MSEFQCHSQDLVVAQSLSGRTAIPAAVWDFPVGCNNVESVVDEVVLQDAVIGCAGCQRRRCIDLESTVTQDSDEIISIFTANWKETSNVL